jgi:hypothetical protein
MQKILTLYYDPYELEFGDGFFPVFNRKDGYKSIDISFEYYDNELTQLSGPVIQGYDGILYSQIVKAIIN